MEQKYGLYSGLHPTQQLNNASPSFLAVRVLDIILDSSHPDWVKYGGWDALGLIKFIPFYSTLTDNKSAINIAKPLFANLKGYPLLEEITYVIQLPDPSTAEDPNYSSYYYTNTVNIWNHPHHNAFPNINYDKLPENLKLDYREIESGLVKNQIQQDKKLFSLGNTFKEKGNIKPLLPFEGDIIQEGRFGQSIRFGSTVKNKNPWSLEGNEGDPIVIIRNGQDPKLDQKGWIPTVENINGDDSSIYMCSGQAIPITVASFNLKSFDTILQEVSYPTLTLVDSPTFPTSSVDNQNQVKESQDPLLPTSSLPQEKVYKEEEIVSFPGEDNTTFQYQSDVDEELSDVEMIQEKYNSRIIMTNKSVNEKGEYALYQGGQLIGYSAVSYIGSIRVATKYESQVKLLLEAAKKSNVPLKINSSLRTFDEQLALRKQNIKNKSKKEDEKTLLEAPSSDFFPQTGKPGFSNHQNGRAFDFNTGIPSVYKWMVANAPKFGFVRTVPSERWHWEYLPNVNQFAYVAKDHATWDKLV